MRTESPEIAHSESEGEGQKKERFFDLLSETERMRLREGFEQIETKERIRNVLKAWEETMQLQLRERTEHFGLGHAEADTVLNRLMSAFQRDLAFVGSSSVVEELRAKALAAVDKIPEAKGLRSTIEILSPLKLLSLIERKLGGEVTPEEKTLLEVLFFIEHEGATATHDPLTGRIEIQLLSPLSLQEYGGSLVHEFTHYGLNRVFPEAGERQISKRLKALRTSKETTSQNASELFLSVERAFGEAAAHRASCFAGVTQEPNYEAYRNLIPPTLFRAIYPHVDKLAAGRSLAEFDAAVIYLYRFLTASWHPQLSETDVQKAVADLVEEIKKL